MLKLKRILREKGVTQAALAEACHVSPAGITQLLTHGAWPKSIKHSIRLRNKLTAWCEENGVQVTDCLFQREVPQRGNADGHQQPSSEEDSIMLLRRQTLTPEAKKQFGLFSDPFGDLRNSDDMWLSADIRYIREHMQHTATNGGFLAVIGESGAGKSTLRRDLEQRVSDGANPVMLIQPYILAAEDRDAAGKTLKATHIAEAVLRTIAPYRSMPNSPEARFAAVHAALKESHDSGYRHCLVIEEAHSMPIPTLKHLKRFLELEVGFTKLISIILIGQPELLAKLSQRSAGVREVTQRCEITMLKPISVADIHSFIAHRLKRQNCPVEKVINEDGIAELVHRLTDAEGTTHLYPLAVGNFLIAAMNLSASIGAGVIDADVIKGVG